MAINPGVLYSRIYHDDAEPKRTQLARSCGPATYTAVY
jgi:hypothetical protein